MVKLNEKSRKELWEDMNNIEFRINSLKSIFQNEIPIEKEMLNDFIKEKEDILDRLNEIQYKFQTQIKAEELYQKIIKDLKSGIS
ncbi:hypothetical protein AM596_15305 [Clostridium perfringens CP4]|uniref:hypothetical protein n=1 Tax=Clostridium perfringens TaxID=1502 RepID=UPI0007081ADE|nr:hypothetical protein [Clostridium perfringens]KQC91296.1 hypothetical protein AM596_15305 [Clostridium perfringens CP4]